MSRTKTAPSPQPNFRHWPIYQCKKFNFRDGEWREGKISRISNDGKSTFNYKYIDCILINEDLSWRQLTRGEQNSAEYFLK
jgi:hypothetical protein